MKTFLTVPISRKSILISLAVITVVVLLGYIGYRRNEARLEALRMTFPDYKAQKEAVDWEQAQNDWVQAEYKKIASVDDWACFEILQVNIHFRKLTPEETATAGRCLLKKEDPVKVQVALMRDYEQDHPRPVRY